MLQTDGKNEGGWEWGFLCFFQPCICNQLLLLLLLCWGGTCTAAEQDAPQGQSVLLTLACWTLGCTPRPRCAADIMPLRCTTDGRSEGLKGQN
jgi:hypothetical protein